MAELVDRENVKNESIAVMGSGIAGISSALELAKRGYKVKVYSKIIPNMNKVDNTFFCTS